MCLKFPWGKNVLKQLLWLSGQPSLNRVSGNVGRNKGGCRYIDHIRHWVLTCCSASQVWKRAVYLTLFGCVSIWSISAEDVTVSLFSQSLTNWHQVEGYILSPLSNSRQADANYDADFLKHFQTLACCTPPWSCGNELLSRISLWAVTKLVVWHFRDLLTHLWCLPQTLYAVAIDVSRLCWLCKMLLLWPGIKILEANRHPSLPACKVSPSLRVQSSLQGARLYR